MRIEPQPRSVSPAGRFLGFVLTRLGGCCGWPPSSDRFRLVEALSGVADAAVICLFEAETSGALPPGV